MTKNKLFDPKVQQPIPSKDCPEFSVDVFIIDEKEMHGLACYHFEDKKWIFHTDTLVDYDEKGAETQWRWYYPDVQWSEEAIEPDFKALYLEGREVINRMIEYSNAGKTLSKIDSQVAAIGREYLTKHNDLT